MFVLYIYFSFSKLCSPSHIHNKYLLAERVRHHHASLDATEETDMGEMVVTETQRRQLHWK